MRISIVIATRNRSAILRETLESILHPGSIREKDWEVVVVDNGSTDRTPAVCSEFQERWPGHFRCFVEMKAGGSNAKNLGISKAQGEILAFTDDDVRCAPDYPQKIREVFAQHSPDAVQGRVLLDCEGGRPPWISDAVARFMSQRDYGDHVLPWNDNLSGTNMIVRAEVFRRVGGFSPQLGTGTAVGFAEDSEVSMRIRRAGFRLIYAPEILVWHRLPAERLTRTFLRRRFFNCGRSYAYFEELPTPLWRFAAYMAKEFVIAEARAYWDLFRGRPGLALDRQCAAWQCAGLFWQHRLFRRGAQGKLDRSFFGAIPGNDRR
jgi:glycosyltransferase involved in cell wall biosynthesis